MAFPADVNYRAQNRIGTILNGKWRLDQVIGVGGMATVFGATHRNQKRVAVKMLHPELSLDESVRLRFLREGYVANTVGHPGAVTVFDDDLSDDGAAFLVMELLEGETVHARLLREGVFALEEALIIGEDTLDVLVAAHEKGIVHRDLKPENLFLTRAAGLKLLDFGIARLRELPMGTGASTANGLFMGTPAFMSPEHARGKWNEVDAQSDLWSVGATLFTLFTGKFVHESETPVDALVLAVTEAPRPIRSVSERVPDAVAQVVDRALAYHKEDRWASAREMQTALRNARLSLAPEELVLRGGQRSDPVPERSPSSPRGDTSATVRSSLATSPRVPTAKEGAVRPVPTDSFEPIDTTPGGASHQRIRPAVTSRGWLVVWAGLALAGAVFWVMHLRGRSPDSLEKEGNGQSQVLAPTGALSPGWTAPAGPSAGLAGDSAVDSIGTTGATAPLASASAAQRAAHPEHRPPRPAALHETSLAPSAVPAASSESPRPRDNPFDRRF